MKRVTRLNASNSNASRNIMTQENSGNSYSAIAALALGAGLLGFAGGWGWQASGLGREATEEVVRSYILENPEILPEAIDNLQQKQLQARLEPVRDALEQPFPGAVLGNPDGAITLVEFTDYSCPYCRMSIEGIEGLIADNPDLKVVIRENPILSMESVEAARMALAAAEQGRFEAFYFAMFAKDRPGEATIEQAAREAGVDLAVARAEIATGKYDFELENNARLTQSIGFTGTPAWVVGDQAFSGAVPQETLAEAIARARES